MQCRGSSSLGIFHLPGSESAIHVSCLLPYLFVSPLHSSYRLHLPRLQGQLQLISQPTCKRSCGNNHHSSWTNNMMSVSN